jgi:hypothetical protein
LHIAKLTLVEGEDVPNRVQNPTEEFIQIDAEQVRLVLSITRTENLRTGGQIDGLQDLYEGRR